MGNFSRTRLSEADLRMIYDWAKNQIGFRPFLQARVAPPTQAANGMTYTVNVTNAGMPGKGISAQGVTVNLQLPAGASVVAATGPGYKLNGNTAEWVIPALAPKQQQSATITLSKAAAPGELKGTVHWSVPKPSPDDVINVAVPNAG
jgi:uncharacterized repeat protein (TIGR01451 family)